MSRLAQIMAKAREQRTGAGTLTSVISFSLFLGIKDDKKSTTYHQARVQPIANAKVNILKLWIYIYIYNINGLLYLSRFFNEYIIINIEIFSKHEEVNSTELLMVSIRIDFKNLFFKIQTFKYLSLYQHKQTIKHQRL